MSVYSRPVVKLKDEPSATKNKKTFEEVLQDCDGFGKFQFLILVTLLLPEIPAAFVTFAPVFVGSLSSSNWTCVVGLDTAQGPDNATKSAFAVISILGSVVSLLLEETAGQVLTDDEEHKPKK